MKQLDQHQSKRSSASLLNVRPKPLLPMLIVSGAIVVAVGLLIALYLYGIISGPRPVRSLSGHRLWVTSVAWSPDGKLVAAASADTTVLVWNATSGNIVTTLKFRGSVLDVAWSPDSKYLATAAAVRSEDIQVWDAADWHLVHTLHTDPQYLITETAWSPDGRSLVVVANNIETWDVATEQHIAKLLAPNGSLSAAWSPDGKLLAADTGVGSQTGVGNGVLVWNLARGDGPATVNNSFTLYGHSSFVDSVSWSPDGRFVASGSDDGTVKLWDVTTKQNTATFTGHKNSVVSVAWSPDGKKIASGSWDRTAKVWDVATGQNIATFEHPDFVTSVAWSPDSKYLVTGDHSTFAEVRIWKVK